MVEMISVSSSNVHSIGYDEENKKLFVKFLNGSLYVYYSVPITHYKGLLNASSVGSYLDSFIKKGGYLYTKL